MIGKALVTGGAGFIGSHLSELLLDEGWEVFALDDLSTGAEANIFHLREREGFHLVVDSVLSPAVVSELVHRCDVVYHLAAAVGVRLIVEQPGRTLLTNVQGTENVLEYCAPFEQARARRLELRGLRRPSARSGRSTRTHGASTARRRRSAGPTPTRRRWTSSSRSRYDQERGLRLRDRPPLQHRRPPTERPVRDGHPALRAGALAGEPLEVHGDGTQTRCFCHVSDTVRALKALIAEPATAGGIFNVGSTERIRSSTCASA